MNKYLVTIEFRYRGVRNNEPDSKCITKTIGIFGTKEEAYNEANKIFPELEKRWKLNPNYNIKERFKKRSFNIISNLAYIKTPFNFFVKVTELHMVEDINEELDIVLADIDNYINLKEELC